MIGVMLPLSKLVRATRPLLVVASIAMSGCQTAPTVTAPSAPLLELLQSAPLALADDCRATGSVVVEFTVLENGRADAIRAAAAEPCIQQALTAWVGSFRYAPPGRQTAESMEWMLVTARKGS